MEQPAGGGAGEQVGTGRLSLLLFLLGEQVVGTGHPRMARRISPPTRAAERGGATLTLSSYLMPESASPPSRLLSVRAAWPRHPLGKRSRLVHPRLGSNSRPNPIPPLSDSSVPVPVPVPLSAEKSCDEDDGGQLALLSDTHAPKSLHDRTYALSSHSLLIS